jgi:ribose transport system permease protein
VDALRNSEIFRLLVVFILIVALGTAFSGGVLLRPENISNVLQQNAVLLVLATAQFMVIATGGIDLSVGAVVALTSVVFMGALDYGIPAAVGAALLAGALFGLINGALVTYVRLPAFVATLGTMQIGYSLAQLWTGGGTLQFGFGGTPMPDYLTRFYGSYWFGVPSSFVFGLIILGLSALYMRTFLGRHIFAVGGNSQAARLAGIPVVWVRVCAYVAASMVTAVGGVLFAMRVGYGDPNAGFWLPLDSIAAVAIGGVSLAGGTGHISSGFIGVLILATMDNVLNLTGVPVTLQPLVKGALLVLTAIAYGRQLRR